MSAKIKVIRNAFVVLGLTLGIMIASTVDHEAQSQDKSADNMPLGRQAVAIVDGKYPASYFPNTELLGAAEMRLTALGTGMPNQTRAAVSIAYLLELGNGDKFLFDMGSGSLANLFSLRPDFEKLDKVFASHLHIDHVGDFMSPAYWRLAIRALHTYPHLRAYRIHPGTGYQGVRRWHEQGLCLGPRHSFRCAAR